MKKIINLIVACGALISMASCDLDLEPTSGPTSDKVLNLEQIKGLRRNFYNDLKAISSGAYLYNTDWFADVVSETINSGNTGAFFHLWLLYPNNSDIYSLWASYYSVMTDANYAIMKMEEAVEADVVSRSDVQLYIGEAYFLRAYALNQLALRFCQDYDPAKASTQLGVPLLTKYSKDPVNAPRGTLADVYTQIQSDITEAELAVKTAGSANAIYLTADAITAFKAQIALQMHDYPKASQYASSLYEAYPLINNKEHLEQMWREDLSTETIFQPEVTRSTLATVGSMQPYYFGQWQESSKQYVCAPYYVLEQKYVDLYSAEDYRMGIYLEKARIQMAGLSNSGYVLSKFIGNKTFQTDRTQLAYRNMPKIFRIAQMYLIDAEAQYRHDGGGAGPLNTLRQSRGLETTDATGDALFEEIQKEYMREMVGEGQRLFDIKRWEISVKRNNQSLGSILTRRGDAVVINAASDRIVWPIPQDEISNNPNFGSQNPGYAQ